MITDINNEATSNTPTKRLTNEEIYRDIKYCVEQQVSEMFSSYYYDWSKTTTYDSDISINNFSWGMLVSLNEDNFDEFLQQMAGVFGQTAEEEQILMEAFPRYVKIWNENWQKMVIETGMSKEVYEERKEEAFNRIEWEISASGL